MCNHLIVNKNFPLSSETCVEFLAPASPFLLEETCYSLTIVFHFRYTDSSLAVVSLSLKIKTLDSLNKKDNL